MFQDKHKWFLKQSHGGVNIYTDTKSGIYRPRKVEQLDTTLKHVENVQNQSNFYGWDFLKTVLFILLIYLHTQRFKDWMENDTLQFWVFWNATPEHRG